MTHLDQVTKQATDALNAYAAKAGVPADKIPALIITEADGEYRIKTPGARVSLAIAEAINIDGMSTGRAANYTVTVYPTPATETTESLERYMLRNGFDRNDI